jgi:diguanylate cyclase (GGDEF)-like protein
VALIDIDDFKPINDRFGHTIGDDVLRIVAAELAGHVRDSDLAARWGGDEFAVLFRGVDEATAHHIATRIRLAIERRDWSALAPGLEVKVSVGLVAAQPGDTARSLLERSDAAMYRRKRSK